MTFEEQMIKMLEKMETKIDGLDSRLDSVDRTLVRQEATLGEHIRRTELAEAGIKTLSQEIRPIQRHVDVVGGVMKAVGFTGVLVSVVMGVIKLVHVLSP